GHGGMPRRPLRVADAHLLGEPLHDVAVVLLAEIGSEAADDRIADLVDRIELLAHVAIVRDQLFACLQERIPRAVGPGEQARRRLADVTDAERIEEALERNLPARLDGTEQIAHRSLAIAFLFLEAEGAVAGLQRENV